MQEPAVVCNACAMCLSLLPLKGTMVHINITHNALQSTLVQPWFVFSLYINLPAWFLFFVFWIIPLNIITTSKVYIVYILLHVYCIKIIF